MAPKKSQKKIRRQLNPMAAECGRSREEATHPSPTNDDRITLYDSSVDPEEDYSVFHPSLAPHLLD